MSVEILQGDNVAAMQELSRTLHRRFALAYLDPPFFTQQTWKTADGEVAFEDKWPSLEHFVATIANAAAEAWRLLIPEGSIVVHVDPETSHYIKVALDHAIGRHRFASEIIWRYRRWPTPTKNFQQMHDVLLRYVVRDPSVAWRWNQLYEPLSPKTSDQWGQQKQRAIMANGLKGKAQRVRSSTTEELSKGAPLSDVWEIGIVGPASPDRTGYPTQKPEALLERLILACTNEGDWVLDPFCGSGTTAAVAHRLGRHCVTIDSSPVAIRYARERLAPMLAQQNLFQPAGSP